MKLQLRQEVFTLNKIAYLDADGKDQQSHHLLGYDTEGVLAATCDYLPRC